MDLSARKVLSKIHWCLLGHRTAKYRILLGAMVLGLSQAMPWFYGNFITYEYSYFRYHLKTSDVYGQVVWIFPIVFSSLVVGMSAVESLIKRTSLPFTLISSMVGEAVGLGLSYITVQHSVWATVPALGILYGFVQGVKLACGLLYAKMWFRNNIGVATSMVVATNGLGGVIFNTIITSYMNPSNLKPDGTDGNVHYFSYKEMNERFPKLFLIICGGTVCVHIVAVLLTEVLNVGVSIDEEERALYADRQQLEISSPKPKYDSIARKPLQDINENGDKAQESIQDDTSENASCCYEESSGNDSVTSTAREDHALPDKSPVQVLKSAHFYSLWLAAFAASAGLITTTNCFKLFSQRWIHDDKFLALIGSMNCVGVIMCRASVGFVVDRFGDFNSTVALLTTNAVCLAFWYFTAQAGRYLFLVYTSLLIGVQSTLFSIFPVAVLRLFGSKYYATNTSFLLTSVIASSLSLPRLMSGFVAIVGWFWFFELVSSISVFALVVLVLRYLLCKSTQFNC